MLDKFNIVSLYGFNNLRKLQYNIGVSQLSKLHQQLQTVSSSLISEVNFTFHCPRNYGDDDGWGDIDNLMIQNFPALSLATMIWIAETRVTWDHCVSRCVAALPRLHQKGILRPLLPPPRKLK